MEKYSGRWELRNTEYYSSVEEYSASRDPGNCTGLSKHSPALKKGFPSVTAPIPQERAFPVKFLWFCSGAHSVTTEKLKAFTKLDYERTWETNRSHD